MKHHPRLLAVLTTLLMISSVTLLTTLPGLDAQPIERVQPGRPARAALPAEDVQTTPAGPFGETEEKVSLASVPLEDQVEPEAGRAGVVLLRWPDGKPLARVSAEIFGTPLPGIGAYQTSKDGRIDLDPALATERLHVHVRVPGFELLEARIGPFERHARMPRLMLRPLEGWIGRVVSTQGGPAAGVPVSGWWIETARPFTDEMYQERVQRAEAAAAVEEEVEQQAREQEANPENSYPMSPTPAGEERTAEYRAAIRQKSLDERRAGSSDGALLIRADEGVPFEHVEKLVEYARQKGVRIQGFAAPPPEFVASHGELTATALTDADGYFYIEPLEAEVHGELTLFVLEQDESSDVLRLDLPREHGRLPDLVLHRPIELRGRVVDGLGAPIAGALVVPQFEQGWSGDLEPLRSDEKGEFRLSRPMDPIVLAVEKVGYELQAGEERRPESADGLWDALVAITPEGASSARLFGEAYGELSEELHPRSRAVVPVDPWQSDIQLVMHARAPVTVKVKDGANDEIEGARVSVRYGGLDAQAASLLTDGHGDTSLPAVDLLWQPMIVRVDARGYHDERVIVRLDQSHLRFTLRSLDEQEATEDGGDETPRFTGQVLGLLPGERAQLAVYTTDHSIEARQAVWTGQTEGRGAFRMGALSGRVNLYLFAWTEDGGRRRAGKFGPFNSSTHRTFSIALEDALPMKIHLGTFDAEFEHRLQVRYAPFPGAADAMVEQIDLGRASSWRSAHVIEAPLGWTVRAFVEQQMEDNVPIVDFLRTDRRQRAYKSLRTTWTDWVPASEVSTLGFAYEGSAMRVDARAAVDLSGSIADLPAGHPRLYVAALGAQGHWVTPVDGNGWFEFVGIPAGKYRMLLYSPPDTEEGLALDGQGTLLGSRTFHCPSSRHNLLLPFESVESE